ncbi:MAG: type IV pilus modification protein PilV [Colwellia sp.]
MNLGSRCWSALIPSFNLNSCVNYFTSKPNVCEAIYKYKYDSNHSDNGLLKLSRSNTSFSLSSVKSQKGASLIEVLISLLVLVLGILGALATQALAVKSTFDAKQRTLATHYAQDIIARMRANHPSALSHYAKIINKELVLQKPDKQCNTPLSSCTPEQIAEKDLYDFQSTLLGGNEKGAQNNKIKLIGAVACIEAKPIELNALTNSLSGAASAKPSKKNEAYVKVSVSIAWQNKTMLKEQGISSCQDKAINNQIVSISSTMI